MPTRHKCVTLVRTRHHCVTLVPTRHHYVTSVLQVRDCVRYDCDPLRPPERRGPLRSTHTPQSNTPTLGPFLGLVYASTRTPHTGCIGRVGAMTQSVPAAPREVLICSRCCRRGRGTTRARPFWRTCRGSTAHLPPSTRAPTFRPPPLTPSSRCAERRRVVAWRWWCDRVVGWQCGGAVVW